MKKWLFAMLIAASVTGTGCQFETLIEDAEQPSSIITEYTVTFITDNGEDPFTIADVTEGSLIAAPVEPLRPGYAFIGWYKTASSEPWKFKSDTVVEDTVLHAKWDLLPSVSGTVKYIDIEGGFYGIITDSGINLDPVNLSDEFKKDGLRVTLSYIVLPDIISTHMWGTFIKISSIKAEKDCPPLPGITGTVKYLDFEGGFYGILTDNGMKLDPINLPLEFRQDGLRVSVSYIVKAGYVSFHMWGALVEIKEIVKIGDVVLTL